MQMLYLEDDIDLGQAVVDHLEAEGHAVHWCKRVAQARQASAFDLALLDLHLPDGEGLTLLRDWRAEGVRQPVIVLTARDQVSDRIRGLKAGADDYLVKPFDLDELLARVDAVCRRSSTARRLVIGAVVVDLATRQAEHNGERIELTAMEWAVLLCLSRHQGRIYSRPDIESALNRNGIAEAASNSIEVIVSRLRKKLGSAVISTHRGLGYRLDG
ncbi:response regulator transcription factor [Ideonella sp. A 288]|uniref:response regulator transcription factor n=1 Tax=Ideonella sp. A 288 TaxID=1962181 RepID=UPI000B4AC469|nr:response regulator transcription factor [Ideonella sp. A 288]